MARNSLVLAMDDTESAGLDDAKLLAQMKMYSQRLPSGRSKAVSRAYGGKPLTWSCPTASSGPESRAELARGLTAKEQGDRVRWIDIRIPNSADGGIFASGIGVFVAPSERRVFLANFRDALARNGGRMFDKWINWIGQKNHVALVKELVQEFIDLVAKGEDSLEVRFASKFAVIYAAGIMGVRAKLLPWTEDWVRQAVRHCYDSARQERDPHAREIAKAMHALNKLTTDDTRFPRHAYKVGATPKFGGKAIGLRVWKGPRTTWYLCSDRLQNLPCHVDGLFESLQKHRLLVSSGNSTSSEQLRVVDDKGGERKVRFWRLQKAALATWAESSPQ